MKPSYQKTIYACFIGYIVQAIVNNFVPLLFLTFEKTYRIPLSRITMLITINFGIQLLVDLLSAGFVDKIGYRISVVLAHIFAAVGLAGLVFLPDLLPDPFAGLLLAVCIYALGGGLIEVLISPIVESCPTDNKEKAMSLLHSFYCWGTCGCSVAVHHLFLGFRYRQLENTCLYLGTCPGLKCMSVCPDTDRTAHRRRGDRNVHGRTVLQQGVLAYDAYDALCGGKRAGCQPVGIYVCGKRTWRDKDDR